MFPVCFLLLGQQHIKTNISLPLHIISFTVVNKMGYSNLHF